MSAPTQEMIDALSSAQLERFNAICFAISPGFGTLAPGEQSKVMVSAYTSLTAEVLAAGGRMPAAPPSRQSAQMVKQPSTEMVGQVSTPGRRGSLKSALPGGTARGLPVVEEEARVATPVVRPNPEPRVGEMERMRGYFNPVAAANTKSFLYSQFDKGLMADIAIALARPEDKAVLDMALCCFNCRVIPEAATYAPKSLTERLQYFYEECQLGIYDTVMLTMALERGFVPETGNFKPGVSVIDSRALTPNVATLILELGTVQYVQGNNATTTTVNNYTKINLKKIHATFGPEDLARTFGSIETNLSHQEFLWTYLAGGATDGARARAIGVCAGHNWVSFLNAGETIMYNQQEVVEQLRKVGAFKWLCLHPGVGAKSLFEDIFAGRRGPGLAATCWLLSGGPQGAKADVIKAKTGTAAEFCKSVEAELPKITPNLVTDFAAAIKPRIQELLKHENWKLAEILKGAARERVAKMHKALSEIDGFEFGATA